VPLTSSEVVGLLSAQGYRLSSGYLGYLVRENRLLRPETKAGTIFLWLPADIERLRSVLHERDRGPALAVRREPSAGEIGGRP
jgi:hypothetical protein